MILRRITMYFIAGLVSIVFLMSFIAPTPTPAVIVTVNNGDHTVTIEAKAGASTKEYDVVSVSLEKNTEYNITFKVPDTNFLHNLYIDRNNDVTEATAETPDTGDTLVGVANNEVDSGGIDTWSVLWTTPDEDVTIKGFCGFTGHFATMKLDFVVGEGSAPQPPASGFEFVAVLAGLGMIAVIISNKRK